MTSLRPPSDAHEILRIHARNVKVGDYVYRGRGVWSQVDRVEHNHSQIALYVYYVGSDERRLLHRGSRITIARVKSHG